TEPYQAPEHGLENARKDVSSFYQRHFFKNQAHAHKPAAADRQPQHARRKCFQQRNRTSAAELRHQLFPQTPQIADAECEHPSADRITQSRKKSVTYISASPGSSRLLTKPIARSDSNPPCIRKRFDLSGRGRRRSRSLGSHEHIQKNDYRHFDSHSKTSQSRFVLGGPCVRLYKCKDPSLYLHVAWHCRSAILSPRAAMKKKRTVKIPAICASLVSALIVTTAGLIARAANTSTQSNESGQKQQDWPAYGGAPENNHYSKLAQINRSNVKRLAVAWSFDTQEVGGLQTSPIIVEGVLYGITPTQKVFALDAATGQLLWKFDSGIRGTQPDRGLAYWADGKDKRILVGVMNFVYALDATTGSPIASFGDHGRIDLRENLGREPASSVSVDLTSPAVVYKDLLIVGGRNPETLPAPPGDIRAYDARTGKLRWSFHTIPRPGEFGHDTWPKDVWKTSG